MNPRILSILRLDRLRQFIGELAALFDNRPDESALLAQVHPLLTELVHRNDWLSEDCARPDPQRYQQYLLYVDSRQHFSVVSLVWGLGRITPVHDHRVWGLTDMLCGVEYSQPYTSDAGGRPHPSGVRRRLGPGEIEALSPRIGDVYQVSNTFSNHMSISTHAYGANIGAVRRAVSNAGGGEKPFISSYSNSRLSSIWDLSKENPA